MKKICDWAKNIYLKNNNGDNYLFTKIWNGRPKYEYVVLGVLHTWEGFSSSESSNLWDAHMRFFRKKLRFG